MKRLNNINFSALAAHMASLYVQTQKPLALDLGNAMRSLPKEFLNSKAIKLPKKDDLPIFVLALTDALATTNPPMMLAEVGPSVQGFEDIEAEIHILLPIPAEADCVVIPTASKRLRKLGYGSLVFGSQPVAGNESTSAIPLTPPKPLAAWPFPHGPGAIDIIPPAPAAAPAQAAAPANPAAKLAAVPTDKSKDKPAAKSASPKVSQIAEAKQKLQGKGSKGKVKAVSSDPVLNHPAYKSAHQAWQQNTDDNAQIVALMQAYQSLTATPVKSVGALYSAATSRDWKKLSMANRSAIKVAAGAFVR